MNAKEILRSKLKQVVGCITEDSVKEQSGIITRKLLNSQQYRLSTRVGVYLSMKTEVQTNQIIQNIFESGKQCFIPWYVLFIPDCMRYNKDVMKLVKLDSLKDLAALPYTKWNIQQYSHIEGREEALTSGGLDLVLVPGLAFTTSGKRLGRGKGYYDKFLSDAQKIDNNHTELLTIGLAFNEQILEHIPCDQHDFILSYVLSPDTATNFE